MGSDITAGVGRFADGRPAEIFLNTAKQGTALDVNARDAAVAASLLLQHCCPIEHPAAQRSRIPNVNGAGDGRKFAHALDLLA